MKIINYAKTQNRSKKYYEKYHIIYPLWKIRKNSC